MHIEEYVPIREYSTFKVGGTFRYFVRVADGASLPDIKTFADQKNLPLFILGGGSNIIFPDGVFDCVAIKIEILGFEIISKNDTSADIKIGAGENWDSVVKRAVDLNLSGIEALSAIPGTTGATPVQNVGAYGCEIKDVLFSVDVWDSVENKIKTLSNADCRFAYRDSIFKQSEKGRYVILSLILRLSKGKPIIPNYNGVKKYFEEKGINDPTLVQIRDAITEIRWNKLPDPKRVSNVGSFFKNPIIKKEQAVRLQSLYPNISVFPVDDTSVKIPAGWLIENAGLKGKDFGTVSTYLHNALVLVNNGEATRADVVRVCDEIIKTVFDKFEITLESEPEFL